MACMSQDPAGHPASTRADELRRVQQKRRQRMLMAFALIEGLVLALAVIAIYVLRLIDPAMGVWVLVAIALVGGSALSAFLVLSLRRDQRELETLAEN